MLKPRCTVLQPYGLILLRWRSPPASLRLKAPPGYPGSWTPLGREICGVSATAMQKRQTKSARVPGQIFGRWCGGAWPAHVGEISTMLLRSLVHGTGLSPSWAPGNSSLPRGLFYGRPGTRSPFLHSGNNFHGQAPFPLPMPRKLAVPLACRCSYKAQTCFALAACYSFSF